MMQPETNFPKHPTCLGCGHRPHDDGHCTGAQTFTGGGYCMCSVEDDLPGDVCASGECAPMKELEARVHALEVEREARRPQQPMYFRNFPLYTGSFTARVVNISLKLEGDNVALYIGNMREATISASSFWDIVEKWPR